MPIWATLVLLKLHSQPLHFNDFIKHGEFVLYAAAFLAPALQSVVRYSRDSKYVLGTGAALFAVVGLVISGIIYAGVAGGTPSFTEAGSGPQQSKPINEIFLYYVSIMLLTSSLGF